MLDRVVVINDDTEESGGAAAVALASVRLLRERRVPVTVLSGDGGSAALLMGCGKWTARRWVLDASTVGSGSRILDGCAARSGAAKD